MLLLLLAAGEQRYAIEGRHVVEVIPRLEPTAQPDLPAPFCGVIGHRGRIVPVLDLASLLAGRPCQDHLSSRILVLNGGAPWVGLLAERVTDTLDASPAEFTAADLPGESPAWLGGIRVDGVTMVRWLDPVALLRQTGRGARDPAGTAPA